jgi:hypothetical protein
MNAWSANVEDRRQIFIILSHKQTKLLRSIEFSAMLSQQSPATGNLALLPEVSRNKNEIAVFCAPKIMKRLVAGQSGSFFNI